MSESLFLDAPNGETVALVALTLAHYGDAVNSKLSDLIPQATWDWLFGSGFLRSGRDNTDEGYVNTTREGHDALLAWAEVVRA